MSVSEIVGEAITIQFPRSGDRFAHSILLDGQPVATSLEGGDADDWPPSPPLQQLSIEDLGNGPVGLLVGMAGRSHWSLSVELQGNEVVFDAACRIRGDGGELGSHYRLHGEQHRLNWRVDSGPGLAAAELDVSSEEAVIRIIDTIDDGATLRWRYRLTLV